MKKILSVLLAVLMVATLIPAMFVAAEDDGAGEAPESAVLDWLTYGVDDCFGVYDIAGTEKGKYKTLLEAELAMSRSNCVLKLLGNVRGVTETYTFRTERGQDFDSFIIDGQGFIYAVQLSTATQYEATYGDASPDDACFVWVFKPKTKDGYVIKNITIVSNAGCVKFENPENKYKSTYAVNNAQLYASDTYYDVNPDFYCVENGYGTEDALWTKPSVLYKAGPNVPAKGYTRQTCVAIRTGSTEVTFNGADTKVVARAAAIMTWNGRLYINDGYFYADDHIYGDATAGAGSPLKVTGDAATIMTNFSNMEIVIEGGEIVNALDAHVEQPNGSFVDMQGEAIRLQNSRKLVINGGTLRAPGSIVHARKMNDEAALIEINGGTLIKEPFGLQYAEDGGKKREAPASVGIVNLNHADTAYAIKGKPDVKGLTVNINGGLFINRDEVDASLIVQNNTQVVNLNGGIFLNTTNKESKINKIHSASTETLKINKDNKVNWEGEDYYFLGMLPLANENAPTMEVGAAIRLKKNTKAALRFEAVFTTLQLDMLEAEADDKLKFGAVIVPTDKLYQHGCYTIEALTAAVGIGGFDTIDELTEDDLWETGDGYGYYIEYEVEDEDINTSFTAVPYVTDGVTMWYGAFDLINSSRSVAEVAARALADVTAQKGRLYADASVLATLADFDYSDVSFDVDSVWCYYQAESQQRMLGYLDDEYKAIAVGYVEESLAG